MPVETMECGARIAGLRRDSGYTQEELGTRLGVTAQAISKWERGLSLPDTDLLPDLAAALRAPVDTLLGGRDTRPTAYDCRGAELLEGRGFTAIWLRFGLGLVPVFTPQWLAQIAVYRLEVFEQWGVLLPAVRFSDDTRLAGDTLVMDFYGDRVFEGQFAGEDAGTAILDTMGRQIQAHLPRFVNRHMVKLLVENLRQALPFVVEGVVPQQVSLSRLRDVLRALVARGRPVCNLVAVIEAAEGLDGHPPEAVADSLANQGKRGDGPL